ncbi:hypothetical protein FOMG_09738 [Fusarium oxysporum f. sp. melonis 26406]|uniref:Uncharacterized protein n=1 Tax=Fusarium oxysporum f. sp. melonis 26406 TaxID=1089452 RepID=W9ZXK1_FUSOX|nr:hypothetical protein FOMG_09738 [Fusarium oxysporum f. sp. melonis 26406]
MCLSSTCVSPTALSCDLIQSITNPPSQPRSANIYTVNSTNSTAHFNSMNHAQYGPLPPPDAMLLMKACCCLDTP